MPFGFYYNYLSSFLKFTFHGIGEIKIASNIKIQISIELSLYQYMFNCLF